MTVSTDTNRVKFIGNGVTTEFPFARKFFEDSDLEVRLRVEATEVETVQTITTDYTVSGGGGAVGTVTMVVAPADLTESLIIRRIIPLTQESDFVTQDPFPDDVAENAWDRGVMLSQQLEEKQGRAIRFQPGSGFADVFMKDLVAGKLLKVSDDLSNIEMADTSDDALQDAQDILDQIEVLRDQILAIVDALEGQNITVDKFAGDGADTTFVLTNDAGEENLIFYFLGGVYQQKDTFTYDSGTKTVTTSTAPPGDGVALNIDMVYGTQISLFVVPDGSITTAKLAADAVTGAKIGDDQVDSEHYVAASIDPEHLATSSVETAKINALAVTGAKIANATITADKLAAGLVFGSQVRLETVTASASATVPFTTNIDSTFGAYRVVAFDIVAATNAVSLRMEVSTNGGSTWLSGTEYFSRSFIADGSTTPLIANGGAIMTLSHSAVKHSNVANTSSSFILDMFNPSSSIWKIFHADLTSAASESSPAAAPVESSWSGQVRTVAPIDAIRFSFSSGNIASGKFVLYGLQTS